MAKEQTHFEFGFELRLSYGGFPEFLRKNSDADFIERYTGVSHVSTSVKSEDLTDAVWEDAEAGVPEALMYLGLAARNEISYGRRLQGFEAVPGYLDAPEMPKYEYIKPMTIFQLEIEFLEAEHERYTQEIITPAKAQLRIDKKAEKTKFEHALPRNKPRNIVD